MVNAEVSDRPGKTVVVFEPENGGHQMDYAEALIEHLLRMPGIRRVILLTAPGSAAHPNSARLVARFDSRFELVTTPGNTKRSKLLRRASVFFERQREHCMELGAGLDAIGPERIDFVIVSHFEAIGLVQVAWRPGLFRGRPWASIAVGMRFHHHQVGLAAQVTWQDRVKRALLKLVLRRPGLVCLASVDPTLAEVMRNPKVAWCPEPVEQPATASEAVVRHHYGVSAETCVLLVFGFVDMRKNIRVLLESLDLVDPGVDLLTLIIGQQNREVRALLDGPLAEKLRLAGRLRIIDQFVPFQPETYPFSLADITWIAYRREFVFISSVFSRAAIMGKCVLGSEHGLVGRMIRDTDCGVTVDAESASSVAAALTRLAGDKALRSKLGENGRRAFETHTPEAFTRPILDALRQQVEQQPR